VLENRVLGRMFGSKNDYIIGGLRKMHNEEVHNLYPFPKIKSKRKSWTRRIGGKRISYGVLVRRPEEKIQLRMG
jgi:hypothetical protein